MTSWCFGAGFRAQWFGQLAGAVLGAGLAAAGVVAYRRYLPAAKPAVNALKEAAATATSAGAAPKPMLEAGASGGAKTTVSAADDGWGMGQMGLVGLAAVVGGQMGWVEPTAQCNWCAPGRTRPSGARTQAHYVLTAWVWAGSGLLRLPESSKLATAARQMLAEGTKPHHGSLRERHRDCKACPEYSHELYAAALGVKLGGGGSDEVS